MTDFLLTHLFICTVFASAGVLSDGHTESRSASYLEIVFYWLGMIAIVYVLLFIPFLVFWLMANG